jgi:hypothetical protein
LHRQQETPGFLGISLRKRAGTFSIRIQIASELAFDAAPILHDHCRAANEARIPHLHANACRIGWQIDHDLGHAFGAAHKFRFGLAKLAGRIAFRIVPFLCNHCGIQLLRKIVATELQNELISGSNLGKDQSEEQRGSADSRLLVRHPYLVKTGKRFSCYYLAATWY